MGKKELKSDQMEAETKKSLKRKSLESKENNVNVNHEPEEENILEHSAKKKKKKDKVTEKTEDVVEQTETKKKKKDKRNQICEKTEEVVEQKETKKKKKDKTFDEPKVERKKEKKNKKDGTEKDSDLQSTEERKKRKKNKGKKKQTEDTDSTEDKTEPDPEETQGEGTEEGSNLGKPKKKSKKVPKPDHSHETKGQNRALRYLDEWDKAQNGKANEWKFEKCRQIWLLTNVYNQAKVPDSKFDTLLKYMDSIKGQMRISALEGAKKKVELESKWIQAVEEGKKDADLPTESRPLPKEVERAKEIVLMLEDE